LVLLSSGLFFLGGFVLGDSIRLFGLHNPFFRVEFLVPGILVDSGLPLVWLITVKLFQRIFKLPRRGFVLPTPPERQSMPEPVEGNLEMTSTLARTRRRAGRLNHRTLAPLAGAFPVDVGQE